MKLMNFGCGPDIKDGWTNVDKVNSLDVYCTNPLTTAWSFQDYDFILVNHVLCTMNYTDARFVLGILLETLKVGGEIQIIDMDLLKTFDAYKAGNAEALPAEGVTIDERLCMHVSGFSTRKSLYTPSYMMQLLKEVGFKNVKVMPGSPHDLRPNESLVVVGMR